MKPKKLFPDITADGYITRRDQFKLRDELRSEREEKAEESRKEKEAKANRNSNKVKKGKAQGKTKAASKAKARGRPPKSSVKSSGPSATELPDVSKNERVKDPPKPEEENSAFNGEQAAAGSEATKTVEEVIVPASKASTRKRRPRKSEQGEKHAVQVEGPMPESPEKPARKRHSAKGGTATKETPKVEEPAGSGGQRVRSKPQPIDINSPPASWDDVLSECLNIFRDCYHEHEDDHQPKLVPQFVGDAPCRLSIYWKTNAVGLKTRKYGEDGKTWKWVQSFFLSTPAPCIQALVYCMVQFVPQSTLNIVFLSLNSLIHVFYYRFGALINPSRQAIFHTLLQGLHYCKIAENTNNTQEEKEEELRVIKSSIEGALIRAVKDFEYSAPDGC